MAKRVGDLDIDQDLTFEKRDFTFQKIGRVFMALLILGALLGFFGAGPFSLTQIEDPAGTLSATYERFGRRGATTTLTLKIDGSVADNGKIDVWLSSDYLDRMTVDGITPQPDQVASGDDGEIYTFLVDEPGDPLTVNFNFTIDSMGRTDALVGLKEGNLLSLTHYFVP